MNNHNILPMFAYFREAFRRPRRRSELAWTRKSCNQQSKSSSSSHALPCKAESQKNLLIFWHKIRPVRW
ncbi:hypothetical protein Y032_0077g1098 [Ancylostoma ceylanicum]|uniref:Uncharacterized protein n=1 Tax=Ancylostoma ceylanicum TaxID=53326 RepID=A0A016TV19_9BILA|nr:hypothetical protein Y032_0077g1098 [Ancylostoma ceylanicum]